MIVELKEKIPDAKKRVDIVKYVRSFYNYYNTHVICTFVLKS